MNNTNEHDFVEWSKKTPNLQRNIFSDTKIDDMVRQLKTIIPDKLNDLDNTTENSNLFNETDMSVLNKLKKRFSKKSASDLYKWDWNNNGHGFGSSALGRYIKFLEDRNTISDMIENNGEIFYGLWTPRNNQDKIDKCLHSGIWYRGDGNFNREEEARKIASMSAGDKVFLYYSSDNVKVTDSPFAQYLPQKYLALGGIIAKAKCVGIGKVVSTNIEDLSVKVDWDEDYQGSEWYLYTRQDGVWWFDGKTQDKNKAQALYDIVFNGKEQDYKWWAENGGFNVDTITEGKVNINNQVKNIILYGSPGVGKTHNTNKLINLIDSGTAEKEIFKIIKNNEKNNGINIGDIKDRVKFVTFHQSFGYEDFIEGFRPNEEGNIELKNGIFKLICKDAQKNLDDSLKAVTDIVQEKKFEVLFDLFKDYIQDEIDKNQKFTINNTAYITNIEEDAFRYQGNNWGSSQRMKFNDIELLYSKNISERKEIKQVHDISGLAKQHATYFSYFMKQLLMFKSEQDVEVDAVEKVEQKNYYLVIDEINRGNISKIFGELITLIEEDKRDNLEITLPYSKQPFKIPSNLYIIGTMNSTDKSIALIDIALRRRFTFIKMKPKSDLVPEIARNLFIEINEEITKKLGEDYQIGHSYFMSIQNNDDLAFALEYKIKPLLEEYFYGDEQGYESMLSIIDNGNNITDKTIEE